MIKPIYNKLYSHFGKQHWWPVTKSGYAPKYHKDIKLNDKQKLEICFGAILTQNTNWKNVEKAVINLNKNNLIDIDKIIKISNKKLAKIIKSSGYHNQKAKKLKNFCRYINKNYNNKINGFFNNDIVKLRNELLLINGIGPETADSMILYAAKKPVFVIDAYTKRIYASWGGCRLSPCQTSRAARQRPTPAPSTSYGAPWKVPGWSSLTWTMGVRGCGLKRRGNDGATERRG